MTTNHPELKACPWCKDGGHIRHHLGKKKYCKLHDATSQDYLIYCGNNFETAHARFTGSDEQDAFRRWNARPSPIIPEDAVTREDTVRISDRQKPTSSTGLEPVTYDALRDAVIHNDEHSVTLSRADSASLMNKALRNALNRSLIEKADGFLTGEIEWAVNYAQEWVRGATQGSEENKCLETLINHITKGKR